MLKLDKKDKKILAILDMGARLPLTQIAKKVQLSREVVNYRIKQLEKKKIIENYYVALDTTKLGLIYCRIFLKYRQMTKEKEQQLLQYCNTSKTITWVALGEGKWDITIVLLAKNLEKIEETYDNLSTEFGKSFQNPYLTIAFAIHHFKHNYLYDTKDKTNLVLGKRPTKTYDKLDLNILNTLKKDARMSLIDLAKKVNTTAKVVQYRIKKLKEEKVILAFRTKINTKLLEHDHWKVFLTLQNMTKQKEKQLYSYFQFHPSVIYITKPMGMHNLEFEVMVKSTNELHEFIRTLKVEFGEIIVDYDTMLNYEEPLLTYLPLE
jgi:Lrp/AsnC family transcriptional regulator, leucine-responsive regulatory protein